MGWRLVASVVATAAMLLVTAGCGNDSADPAIPTQRFAFGDTTAPRPAPAPGGLQAGVTSSAEPLAGLTPEQAAAARAALIAYQEYWVVRDSVAANPGADWTAQVGEVATAGAGDNLLSMAAQLAAAGQHGVGSTTVAPTVTSLNAGIVSLTACVDSRTADVLDGTGASARPPDLPGSLRRYKSTAKVAIFNGGEWLVAVDDADPSTGC